MIGRGEEAQTPATILLNSNESAYGPSPLARIAARAAVDRIERYLEDPDRLLAPALADRFDLNGDHIAVGHGSDDLLARLARAYLGPGTELLRTANGYLKVPNYAHANDAEVVSAPDEDFRPSVDNMIAAVSDRTRIVYVANPENPAGIHLSGAEIRRLHAALPDHVLLVLDCAYEEYVDAPDHEPAHRLVQEAPNVVMVRTFSKIFGLAGARVGWMYGPDAVVDTVRRIGTTFPVATPSVAAAIAALKHREHTDLVRAETARSRRWLTGELQALGLQVVPSQANFVLVRFPDPGRSAEAADAALRAQGIVVRRLAAPAYADCLRITLGLPVELQATRDAIAAFLAGQA